MTYKNYFNEKGNSLVFKISRICPVNCDFCCEYPSDTNKLEVWEMKKWVKDIADIQDIVKIISFTGGDCFVHYDDMYSVSKLAYKLGFTTTAITSAYWAKSYSIAKKKLSLLQNVGLKRLSLSCDPSHQKKVPIEYVNNALNAAVDLGLSGFVIGTFLSHKDKVENYIGNITYPKYKFISKQISKFGKAQNKFIPINDVDVNLNNWGCYRQYGHDILVQPDGTVLPCCSTNNLKNNLIFGNLKKGDSIKNVVKLITGNFLLRILKHESFSFLKKITKKYFPEAEKLWINPIEAQGACSYCSKVFKNIKLSKIIFSSLKKEEKEYISQLIKKYSL